MGEIRNTDSLYFYYLAKLKANIYFKFNIEKGEGSKYILIKNCILPINGRSRCLTTNLIRSIQKI